MRLKDAIEKFRQYIGIETKRLTSEYYVREATQLCIYLRNPRIQDIRQEDFVALHELLVEMGYTANGIYRKFISYRRLFRYFNEKGYQSLPYSQIPVPRREYVEPRTIDREIMATLLDSIKSRYFTAERDKALIHLLWDTGARLGELLSLNVSCIEKGTCAAVIRTEKSRGKSPLRTIFWTPETDMVLQTWIRKRAQFVRTRFIEDPDALFISRPTAGRQGKRMDVWGAGDMLRRHSLRAGIPTVNAHSFRHTFARDVAEAGGEAFDVMNLLGHSQVQSSEPYVRLFGTRLRERARGFMGRRK